MKNISEIKEIISYYSEYQIVDSRDYFKIRIERENKKDLEKDFKKINEFISKKYSVKYKIFNKEYTGNEVEKTIIESNIDKNYNIEFEIQKEGYSENSFIFKNVNEIIMNFKKKTLKEIENEFFGNNLKLVIYVLEDKIKLKNKYILLSNIDAESDIQKNSVEELGKELKILEENCYCDEVVNKITPKFFDFKYKDDFEFTEVKEYFEGLKTLIATIFLFNSTKLREENKIKSKIVSKKRIDIEIDEPIFLDGNKVFELYKWAYEENKNKEKIEMIRELISVYMNSEEEMDSYEEFLRLSGRIYKATKEMYKIYIKNDVKSYFEQVNKIKERVKKNQEEILNSIQAIIDSMNKNFLTTLGTVIAVLLNSKVYENDKIFTLIILIYIIFIITNNCYYLSFYSYKTKLVREQFEKNYKEIENVAVETDLPDKNEFEMISKKFYKYRCFNIKISIVLILLAVVSIASKYLDILSFFKNSLTIVFLTIFSLIFFFYDEKFKM